MNTKENKTETGVSLDRETVINKLKPLFENWNDETHMENDIGYMVTDTPKWRLLKHQYCDLLDEILRGKDVDTVLEFNLPEHSEEIEDYDYEWFVKDRLEQDLDEVKLDWNDWKKTESYQKVHDLLDKYQKDPQNHVPSLFKKWNRETEHKIPTNNEDLNKMIQSIHVGDDIEKVLSDHWKETDTYKELYKVLSEVQEKEVA